MFVLPCNDSTQNGASRHLCALEGNGNAETYVRTETVYRVTLSGLPSYKRKRVSTNQIKIYKAVHILAYL